MPVLNVLDLHSLALEDIPAYGTPVAIHVAIRYLS